MHGTSQGAPMPLSGFGGLVTLADQTSLPEGASPRTHDADYRVGLVKGRPGLRNGYSYAGMGVTKPPSSATDVPVTGGGAWTNPQGIEAATSYATVAFGAGTGSGIPASVVSDGPGIPWANPGKATATGSPVAATITGWSVASNVITFVADNAFTADELVTLAGLSVGDAASWNTLTLPVLASGLSAIQFNISLAAFDASLTADSGTATPALPNYASVTVPAAPFTPAGGEYVAYSLPTVALGPESGWTPFAGAKAGISAASWIAGGVCGSTNLGTPDTPFLPEVDCGWSGFTVPDLPAGAAITRIYPVALLSDVSAASDVTISAGVGATQVWSAGAVDGQNAPSDPGLSLGNTGADITGAYINLHLSAKLGTWPKGANVSSVVLAVYYTVSSGAPGTGATQLLEATNLGLTIPSAASITGVEVDFTAGFVAGSGALTAQLTLNGALVGSPQSVTPGAWPQAIPLGGPTNLWGATLTPALVNGSTGLGVTISGNLAAGSQLDLNGLSLTVTYAGPVVSDYLDGQEFGYSLSGTSITGIEASIYGAATGGAATITAQLLKAGAPVGDVKTAALPTVAGVIPFGGAADGWGLTWTDADLNDEQFGLRLQVTPGMGTTGAELKNEQVTAWTAPNNANFTWIQTFTWRDGTVRNLALDASGAFWMSNETTDPGVFTEVLTGIAADSQAVAVEGEDSAYVAFSDGQRGSDMPIQYTVGWQDRITQVGPAAAPVFTPLVASADQYAISSITQPAQFVGGFDYYLQSSGAGSTTPGNVVTIYYLDSTLSPGPNEDLKEAWNNGLANGVPVYLYLSFAGTPQPFGPLVVQVTGIGLASPPGQPRQFYYLQFIVGGAAAYIYYPGSGHSGYAVTFQRTLATMDTAAPVPSLEAGNQITISGSTETAWNNLWTIVQALNSSSMAITETSVTGGVATFSYALAGGSTAAPFAGQLVTITGTTNANGQLNLSNATIATASGGSTGTFTIAVPIAATYAPAPEDGQATTAGTQFSFDPGAALLGTATDPIHPAASDGSLTFVAATAQLISPGTKQGTVFFITRNDYWTAPAPPVLFTVPQNCTALQVSQIPIGPPNVIARGIALTESGQNGTPGANFFTIPTPVTYVVANASYTASSLIINDNSTTSAQFQFPDTVLLAAEAIDIYGFNLFNQIEIGDPGWIAAYASRNFYGQCWNKVQNFNNLSFDGGYLPGAKLVPQGWSQPDAFGSLVTSPKFGDAYYIANNGLTLTITGTVMAAGTATYSYSSAPGQNPAATDPVTVKGTTNGGGVFNVTAATIAAVDTGAGTFTVTGLTGTYGSQAEAGTAVVSGTLPVAGLISQTAFQDANLTPILNANTAYSVRAQCSNPSGIQNGNLVVTLTAGGVVYGTFTLPLAEMATSLAIFTGTLLATPFTTVPGALLLNVQATQLGNGADVLVDRVEVYPTAIPVLTTAVFGSYAGLAEQVDAITGQVVVASENQQPVTGAMVMYDTLYLMKGYAGQAPGTSLYSLQASANLEPADWQEPEVAERAGGACGPYAFDLGEQWFLGASRQGLYLFVGGQPGKIMQEIYQVWDAINWAAASSIWVRVDLVARRIYVGIPLATPNFWLPYAPVNANPTSPNVILMCNFQGLDSGEELKQYPQVHTTMFGTLNAIDMRRKWSIWQIAAPYGATIQAGASQEFAVCNGKGNSKVYLLDETLEMDDGAKIDFLYTTAGLPELTKRAQMPMVGGFGNTRTGYIWAALESLGLVNVRFLPNRLVYPEPVEYTPWTVPGGFTPGKPALYDSKCAVNFWAARTFVEFRESDGHLPSLTNLMLHMKKDPWNQTTGGKQL